MAPEIYGKYRCCCVILYVSKALWMVLILWDLQMNYKKPEKIRIFRRKSLQKCLVSADNQFQNGSEGYPEVETFIAIAKNLHLSLDDLMHDELSQISDFEAISTLDVEIYGPKLKTVSIDTVVKACMGTSPTNFEWIAGFFPDVHFNAEFARIGRIRIQDVEEAQKEVLKAINNKEK